VREGDAPHRTRRQLRNGLAPGLDNAYILDNHADNVKPENVHKAAKKAR
jgi:hypothetical protein